MCVCVSLSGIKLCWFFGKLCVRVKWMIPYNVSKCITRKMKVKNEQSRNDYRKKRNLCVAFARRTKQQYFSSLDLRLIAGNKKFWKTVIPLFSDKISHEDIISLTEDGKTITEDLQMAEIFKNYFSNVIRNFGDRNVPTKPGIANSQNTVSNAINKFRNHPSILSYNKNMERIGCPSFAFEFVSLEEKK